ncbi:pyridoxal phosphate-dependent aminotransferase [Marinobacterium aestuariivivens]|uniref:Aminotransferase n=1 Tax=Marinobacterium aestuariivivens TaxID=1698799 RepID=A0ABW2A001_9GAMM
MATDWSRRALEIESFKVMDLLKRARELEAAGQDVVHMEVGEPDFPTAAPIAEAARQAIEKGLTQYTPAAGIPELRRAIAGFYRQRYGLEVAPERIIVTAGASAALLMVFALLADPGQQFMMADPGYPCNRQFLRLVEARGQLVPVDAGSNFQLTPTQVAEHWRPETAGVLLASPANPTGSVLHQPELAALAESVRQQGGSLVVDELYHGLTYGFDAPTVLQVDPGAFVINSFSKYFGMTGWRLGWIVAPEDAVPHLERLAQNLYISPSTISQYAALAAFSPEALEIFEARRRAFGERRDLLLNGLRALGFGVPVAPQGAFYIYADVCDLTDNAFDFCWDLLERDYLAVTPGLDFGRHRSNDFVRFSYTTSLERIELGLERLRRRFG